MLFFGQNANKKYGTFFAQPPSGGGGGEEETFLSSANYYVSATATGSDNGTSQGTPWSLAQLNAATLSPGDVVALKASDEFEGSITVPTSGTSGTPVIISAYGTGLKPKIYGSVEVTGWTLHSGNIYKATIASNVKQVFADGARMRLARYPNSGYFNITSVGSSTQFTSTELNGAIDYTGATWIGRTSGFTLYHKSVLSSSSQTVNIDSSPTYGLNTGEGFFLCNKLEFLDSAGEWYYDSGTNTLYVWTPNGDSPANYTIRASVLDYGVSIATKNYVNIENLEILHSGDTGIYVDQGTAVTVNNCKIVSPDLFGIYVSNGSVGGIFTNNHISQTGCGIRCLASSSVTIEDNLIEDIGQLENINKNVFTHDNYGTGIYLRNNDPTVRYNTLLNIGYSGINWRGLGNIRYNFINGASQVLDDGGGIYTYNATVPTASNGSTVMYNIIIGVHGNRTGTTATYDVGYGIYMDNGTTGVTIQYNTVLNSSCGLYIHDAGNVTLQYNKLYDNLLAIRASGEASDSYIYDNVFFAANRPGDFTWWTNRHQMFQVNDASSPVNDRNEYYHPHATEVFAAGGYKIFADWKSYTGQDPNSTFDGTALGAGDQVVVHYNKSKVTKNYNVTGTNVRDKDGVSVSNFLLSQFESKILIGENIIVTEI